MKRLSVLLVLLASFSFGNRAYSQRTVTGTVTDSQSGESLIGVNIVVPNTTEGGVTDYDGNYSIEVSAPLPYKLEYSLIGYGTKKIEITNLNETLDVQLSVESILASEVVVSASRVEESILQSPVTVEKLGLRQIKNSAAPDFYDEINNMKGVTRAQASLTFNTINTRGFATAGNTRFVQLQDGMDNAAPLLNFPTGNVVGISELDIQSIELVPGAASALYGPNAFNGILFMNSKSPWDYQGLSVELKGGITDAEETNPLYGFSARYANQVNDKFAYKFNVSTFFAKDWNADNYTDHISTVFCPTASVGVPCFNGVNLYGDEAPIPLSLGGEVKEIITRTGFKEGDLLDNNDATSIKLDAALHYKLTDGIETNISYKYGLGNSVYQGSERYALRDFTQQFFKWELNGAAWNIRAYLSATGAGDSYNMSALGAFTNERNWQSLFYTDLGGGATLPGGWAVAANTAYSGLLAGVGIPGGDAAAARAFAEGGGLSAYPAEVGAAVAQGFAFVNGLPLQVGQLFVQNISGNAALSPNTPEFDALVKSVREGLFQKGGAGFIDNSKMYNVEGNYDFTEKLNNVVGLQIGGSFRKYSLFTDGTIFREVDGRIGINEWGTYAQMSKTFAESFKISGSVRYDKNENFDGQFSPRLAGVYSFGSNKAHNIRASWQTGFRNPTTQGQYIFFPGSQLLLGGTEQNANITGDDGVMFNLFEQGNALALDGQTLVDLEYVQPEKLTAFEVGYKGLIGRRFFVDVAYYKNQYKDFISQLSVLSTKPLTYNGSTYGAGTRWYPYTNVPIEFGSYGVDFGFQYSFNSKFGMSGNYSYARVDDLGPELLVGTPFQGSGYNPGFNTPENKFGFGFQAKNLFKSKSFGFGVNYRYQDEFFYQSSFGSSEIPSYSTIDGAMSYKAKSLKSTFKLGVTNMLKKEYTTNIGNPTIGRTIVFTVLYDELGY